MIQVPISEYRIYVSQLGVVFLCTFILQTLLISHLRRDQVLNFANILFININLINHPIEVVYETLLCPLFI